MAKRDKTKPARAKSAQRSRRPKEVRDIPSRWRLLLDAVDPYVVRGKAVDVSKIRQLAWLIPGGAGLSDDDIRHAVDILAFIFTPLVTGIATPAQRRQLDDMAAVGGDQPDRMSTWSGGRRRMTELHGMLVVIARALLDVDAELWQLMIKGHARRDHLAVPRLDGILTEVAATAVQRDQEHPHGDADALVGGGLSACVDQSGKTTWFVCCRTVRAEVALALQLRAGIVGAGVDWDTGRFEALAFELRERDVGFARLDVEDLRRFMKAAQHHRPHARGRKPDPTYKIVEDLCEFAGIDAPSEASKLTTALRRISR